MKQVAWLLIFALVAGIAWGAWYALRRYRERQLAADARMASFLAELKGSSAAPGAPASAAPAPLTAAVAPKNGSGLAQQKLLFEAAAKAGEADEPALSIQLYARLLARYPDCAFAGPAKAALEAQKRRLSKS